MSPYSVASGVLKSSLQTGGCLYRDVGTEAFGSQSTVRSVLAADVAHRLLSRENRQYKADLQVGREVVK